MLYLQRSYQKQHETTKFIEEAADIQHKKKKTNKISYLTILASYDQGKTSMADNIIDKIPFISTNWQVALSAFHCRLYWI